MAASTDKRNRNVQPDAQSLQSVTSLNLKSKVKAHNQDRVRQSTGDRSSTSGERNSLRPQHLNKPHAKKKQKQAGAWRSVGHWAVVP